jgi:hypothetical protein
MINKYLQKDIYHFFGIFALAIIFIYLLPNILAFVFFGYILISFWNSKKNGFWFALIFLFIDPPGDLFPSDYNYGLPFIPILNLRFQEVFCYVALIKSIKNRNKFYSIYSREFVILLFTMGIIFLYSFLIEKSLYSSIISLKWVFVWTYIYSISILMNDIKEWVLFFRFMFILTFVALGSQILYLILGHPPSYLLGTNFSPMMDYGEKALLQFDTSAINQIEVRPIGCSYIVLTALIGSMFFLQLKTSPFKRNYLLIVMILCYLSIILTATRGWFIAFSAALIIYMIRYNLLKSIYKIGAVIVILIPILLKINVFKLQIEGAFNRLMSIGNVAKGDISAGGSNARGEYSEILFNLWRESPIFGYGFTEFYKENGNGHAGHANLLFHVGIVGMFAFIIFWYKLFYLPIRMNNVLNQKNPYKNSLFTFSIFFITLFILHSTSGQQWGFYLNFGMGTFGQIFYYCYSSFFINEAIKNENYIS